MSLQAIQRFDSGSLFVTDTPIGGRKIVANVTRIGVLEYEFADGSKRRELRCPEEVYAPESLATLDGAALTDDHPDGMVTPDNWRQLAIGHVGGIEHDDTYVRASVHVNDGIAIDKVDAKELRECSCGYWAVYDATPGVHPEFGPYDGVQRKIRYNHVALGGLDWGRAGRNVRLLNDAKSHADRGNLTLLGYSATVGESVLTPRSDAENPTVKVKIKGIEYEAGSQSHLDAVEAERAELIAKASAAEAKAAEAVATATQATADAATAKADAAAAKAKLDAAEAAERARADSERRSRVLAAIRTREPEYLSDKKDEGGAQMADLVVKCLKVFAPNYSPEGKTPDQIAGALELALSMAAPEAAPAGGEGGELPADAAQEGDLGAEETEKPPLDSIHAGRGTRIADAANSGGITLEQLRADNARRRAASFRN